MATEKLRAGAIQELVDKQHGVISRSQLAARGMSPAAIRHSLRRGWLHRLLPGVYAVGRRQVGQRGRWMAAVLACGPDAQLSHRSAAALLKIRKPWSGPVEIVVPANVVRCHTGLRVYRRRVPDEHRLVRPRCIDEIPVTAPAVILVDLATQLAIGSLEAAVNEADQLNCIDTETLRTAIDLLPRRPGARRLQELLDRASYSLTTTVLEQLFLPLALEVGLPRPRTQATPNTHRVDFFWADLGLVVETDSLRYHRTPFKQAADKRRDNKHAASGLTTLRFAHWQVKNEPDYVQRELRAVANLLASRARRKSG